MHTPRSDAGAQSTVPRHSKISRTELSHKLLVQGVDSLGDGELISLVVQRTRRGSRAGIVAARVLLESGGVSHLARLSASALHTQTGMTRAHACAIAAAFELGRRGLQAELGQVRPACASFDAVVAWAHPRLAPLDHEEVWVLGLDGRSALRILRCVARGGQHGCALTARDVLHPVLVGGGTALVVVHNHPSGDPAPSDEDVQMTRALAAACDVVGVPLLDHVVVGRNGATSMLELGVLT